MNDFAQSEGNSGTTAFFPTVSLSRASDTPISVDFTTADGTATVADGDYAATSGTLTFLPGDRFKQIAVFINGDLRAEADETFFVNLSGATNATIARGQGTLTIRNDDIAPTVTQITPPQGPTAGGTSIAIRGMGFSNVSGPSGVRFGSAQATGYVVNSNTEIVAVAPALPAGVVDVTVTNAAGVSATSAASTYTYVAAPTVTAISPTAGPRNGGTIVTLAGTGFASAAGTGTVRFGTAVAAYTVDSDTQITATAPSGTGVVDVTVTTPGGTSATSSADRFTYVARPTVTSVSPAQGTTAGGQSITIGGWGLTGATVVGIGAGAATGVTIVNDTQITATTPAGAAGSGDVRVTTPGGMATLSRGYTYITPPTATGQTVTTAYQTARTITLQGTDAASYAYTQPTGGAGSVSGTGPNVTFTPASGYSGTTSFTFTTTNGTGPGALQSAPATVTVTVTPAAPTVLAQPSSQLVTAGAKATFAAQASGASTVQWQESFDGGASWADIAGATSTVYTSPATTMGDDGKRFRAVFSNAGGTTASNVATLTVAAPTITITIAPTTLSSAKVGVSYSQTIIASGGTADYRFALTDGALPAGLNLSSTGVLSGTPTSGGNFTFTVKATDGSSAAGGPFSGSRAYSLTVVDATIAVGPASLPTGDVGAAYSQTLTASGGTTPYRYTVTGALPPGITLASNGVLSGTPTARGSFNFTITATDSSTGAGPYNGSQAYSLKVNAPPLTLSPLSLPDGQAGAAYGQTLNSTGGVTPYLYTISEGALPAGLTLNATTGAISGTPTAQGAFHFAAKVTDNAAVSISRAYSIVIAAPTIVITPTTLPAGAPGVAYSQTFSATGGTSPYAYAVSAGALPAGLSLSSAGALSGTPTASGAFNFTVTATDATTGALAPYAGARAYTLFISAPTVTISTAVLPAAKVSVAYGQTLTASGGVGPYRFGVTAGTLPAGVSLSSAGMLSGSPTQGGNFDFTVTAMDSSGGTGPFSASRALTLTVDAPTIALTPNGLPNASVGAAYSQSVTATGGVAPYSYAVTAGALPAGVTLATNGVLSGTPTAGGSFSVTITATDNSTGSGAPFSASRAYALMVGAAKITVMPTTLAGGQVGTPFSQQLSASGGTGPYAFVISAGVLPAGISLSSAGVISGTPGQGGLFNFSITATDSSGGSGPFSAIQAYAWSIAAPNPPVVGDVSASVGYGSTNNPIMANLSGGTVDSVAVAAGPAHGVVSVSGKGFLYTPAAGYFGADSFTYTASNGDGASAPATANIAVGAPPAPVTADRSGVTVPFASSGVAIDLSGSISGVYDQVEVAAAPAHGTVNFAAAVATYRPAADYFGPDSFSFTATGPGGTSSTSTVSLTVATPPAPAITPAPAVVVPSASGGGSATISVDLSAWTQGVIDGYRITANARFGSSAITASVATTTSQSVGAQAAGPQTASTFQLAYTPDANFIGTETVTVVAFGPGGDSAPATFTFLVAGKAPDLSGSIASSGTLTVSPTATLIGGPFQALQITRQPAFGTATVQGLNIVFTPGVANGGTTSLDYVIDLPFGSSAAGRLDLTVGQIPASQALVADTIQGRPVTVRISNAAGDPFTGAAAVSISPTAAGSAAIVGTGGTYDLTFTPQGTFSGQAVVGFTLTNVNGTSMGTLTVTVAARPDPSLDPDVRGMAAGQITAARRFSSAQVDNFRRRLESLRDGSNDSRNGLSLNVGGLGGREDRDPRVALRRQLGQDRRLDPGGLGDDRDRDMLGLDFGSNRARPAEQTLNQAGQPNAPPTGQRATEDSRSVGVWTSGSVDWGRQDAQGLRDSRFATQGVTAGVDFRLDDHLIVGGGLGYGEDKTRIGDNGSTSNGKAVTGALYASWRPADGWFVDGVMGMSSLDIDSRRWVVGLLGQANGYADGERSGVVRFASASIGRTVRRQGLSADLYVRMEGRDIALDGFTETSGGLSALTWDALDQSGLSVNLGASWRWTLESRRFGVLRPTARMEWSHELEDVETQGVRYADWAASPVYLVPMDGWSRNALNLDLGAEWSLTDRLMLNLGYRGMLGDASSSHGGLIGLKYGW
nr:putative Ig domain-containing protein [Brevundimonas sp. SORGH_AS_0993]